MKQKESKNREFTIAYGGWYQRTTLHLSEIYDFLAHKKSKIDLSEQKLKDFHTKLGINEVTREVGYLEYVRVVTDDDIVIRYYEDGLYILEIRSSNIPHAKQRLENYYKNHFEPALRYIFSLGAPTPKILADIKAVHPIVISIADDKHSAFSIHEKRYGYVYSKITSKDVTVYKTPGYIFVVATKKRFPLVNDIYEMQIFFREYKDQLQRYLNIHRTVWEQIDEIKQKKELRGNEIERERMKLDTYKKTVTLISNRINQMDNYVKTRSSIAENMEIEDYLVTLFQYKFEVLTNTLEYIKEIWAMTTEYLDSAIQIVIELQDKTTNVSLKSLRLVTALGVIAGLVRYTKPPEITLEGGIYFIVLILITFLADQVLVQIYQRVKYKLNFANDRARFE